MCTCIEDGPGNSAVDVDVLCVCVRVCACVCVCVCACVRAHTCARRGSGGGGDVSASARACVVVSYCVHVPVTHMHSAMPGRQSSALHGSMRECTHTHTPSDRSWAFMMALACVVSKTAKRGFPGAWWAHTLNHTPTACMSATCAIRPDVQSGRTCMCDRGPARAFGLHVCSGRIYVQAMNVRSGRACAFRPHVQAGRMCDGAGNVRSGQMCDRAKCAIGLDVRLGRACAFRPGMCDWAQCAIGPDV